MLIPRVSLVLLELLQNFDSDNNCNKTHQICALNDIINIANDEQPIDTIAYFGPRDLIAPYISPLMSGTPKVIIMQAFKQFNQFELIFNNKIFFLAFGSLETSSNWQYLYDAFTSMQSHVRGVFVAPNRRGLSEHFDWCWRNGFLNVIALVEFSNQSQPYKLYTYKPFPTLNVLELPYKSSNTYFHNKLNNLSGYKVRTAVHYDPPRAFGIPNPHNSNETIYIGYAAKIYLEFLKYHNAGLQIVDQRKSDTYNILAVIDQLNQDVADLSMNPYLPYPGTRTSYPWNMIRWCILVPAKGEIDGYKYFLRPFQLEVWLMFVGMVLYLSFMKTFNEYIDSKFHWTKHRRIEFGHSFIEMLRLMLYLPAPPTYQHFRWHYAWNYGVVAIFGFMLSNLYLAILTSFLSTIISENQVDTLNEMVAQNISIHTTEHEIPIILRNRGLPKGFADLLISRNATEMMQDVIALRSGQAYVAREDTISFVLRQQNSLMHPRFHLAKECITTVPVGFLMPSHSQFKIELDVFTLQTAAAGLINFWFQKTISDAFQAGILTNEKEKLQMTTALSLEHFHFAYLILFYGELVAAIIFILEQFSRLRVQISLKYN